MSDVCSLAVCLPRRAVVLVPRARAPSPSTRRRSAERRRATSLNAVGPSARVAAPDGEARAGDLTNGRRHSIAVPLYGRGMSAVIADLPLRERPRERLMRHGVEVLTERELLALILRQGRSGEGTLDLATSLLIEHGGLVELARARPEELARRSGIGPAKAAAILAAFRLGQLAGDAPGPVILRSAEDVSRSVGSELARLRRERVVVLVCDAGNHVRHTVVVADGMLDRSSFPIREILNAVLRHDGRAFAVAHNHPSGDPTPSEADRRATAELSDAASIVGLRFLDHVIVVGDQWRSVATRSQQMPR